MRKPGRREVRFLGTAIVNAPVGDLLGPDLLAASKDAKRDALPAGGEKIDAAEALFDMLPPDKVKAPSLAEGIGIPRP